MCTVLSLPCPGRTLCQDTPAIIPLPVLTWDMSVVQPHLTFAPVPSVRQCPPQTPQRDSREFGWLPWGLKPFPSLHTWRGKHFTACLMCFSPAWRLQCVNPLAEQRGLCQTRLDCTELHPIMFILNLDIFPNFLKCSLTYENACITHLSSTCVIAICKS